jgi:hypothetical protein
MADKEAILKEALENYQSAYEFARGNIEDAIEDLKFRRGKKEDQWDAEALNVRKDRPCLTINVLPQFIRQVTGDQRQMRPSIKVNPVDSRGDPRTADVLAGLVRYIENRSNAKQVYTTAADSQVTAGIGHWQIITEYASSTTFNQELRIQGIDDGVQVLWDPDSVLPTREDAMFCHVPMDISRAKFKVKWPDAKSDGFAFDIANAEGWYTGDSIRVSVYWVKKPIKRSLVLMPDGSIDDITDQTQGYGKAELQGAAEFYQARGARFEQRDGFKVCRYLMTAADVLETTEWPGMHIPIIPVIGEEVRIGKEVYRHGVVRYARDPQRMVNYYASAEAELMALQPKAPYVATLKQVQNHIDIWDTANTENHSVLIYDADPMAPGPPQRVAPPQASQAIQLGKQQALEDTKRVIGIYDAGLGAKSNETSGKAILARQREGDVGTFVYIDNFGMAIQRTGQILLDLIPHYYDTQRTVRIVGVDGAEDVVDINKPVIEDGLEKTINDLTVGAYDVTLETGPSYSTKREESRDGMREFIQAFPDVVPVIGDLFAKMQDWPYADEIGERMKVMQPPEVKKMLAEKEAEKNPREQPEPPQPTPAEQMQMQAAQLELEAKALENEKTKAEIAKIAKEIQTPDGSAGPDPMAMAQAQQQAEIAGQKANIDAYKAQIDAQKAEQEMQHKERMNQIAEQSAMIALELQRAELAKTRMEVSERDTADVVDNGVLPADRRHGEAMQASMMMAEAFQNGLEAIAKVMSAPKKLVRDSKGNIVGAEPVKELH